MVEELRREPSNLATARSAAQLRFAQYCQQTLQRAQAAYSRGGDHSLEGVLLYDDHAESIAHCQQLAHDRSGAEWMDCALSLALGATELLSLRLEPERHIDLLEVGLRAARAKSDRELEGKALGNIGIMHGFRCEWERAADCHRQALAISREIDDSASECQDLTNLGLAEAGLGNQPAAWAHFVAAMTIAEERGDRAVQATILGNMAGVHFAMTRFDAAARALERQLDLCRELADFEGEATAHTNMGAICRGREQYPEALAHYQRALTIDLALRDRRGEAHARLGLGSTLLLSGRTAQGVACYKLALAAYREVQDTSGEMRAIFNIGVALSNFAGEKREAVAYLAAARRLAVSLGDENQEHEAVALLARNCPGIDDIEGAIDANLRLLTFPAALVDDRARVQASWQLASIFAKQGRFEEALEKYQAAERGARDLGDAALLPKAVRNQGLALMRLGRPADASVVLEDYLAAAFASKEGYDRAQGCWSLAKARNACGDKERAILLMREAERLFGEARPQDAEDARAIASGWEEGRATGAGRGGDSSPSRGPAAPTLGPG